jgi:hypothetical protein
MAARCWPLEAVAFALTFGACAASVDPPPGVESPPLEEMISPVRCENAVTPENPSALSATVGLPGTVELQWPRAAGAERYRVCLDGLNCRALEASDACTADACGLAWAGLSNDERVLARVQSETVCARAAEQTAPQVSFTPVNSLLAGADGFTLFSNCAPFVAPLTNGELRVDQQGSDCVSFLTAGDALWGDGTLEVEMLMPTIAEAPLAGLAMHVTREGHAVIGALTVPPPDLDRSTFLAFRGQGDAAPAIAASALFRLPPSTWVTLRLVAHAGVFSFQVARDGAAFSELIRWPSPQPEAAGLTGRPGLAIGGNGKVRFRNFRLHTDATLPARGPSSVRYSFEGSGLPDDWYLRGMPSLDWRPCPSLDEANGCTESGGCLPSPHSGCVYLSRSAATGVGGTAAFDFPVGIDVSQPWSLSLRLAALDGGFLLPQFISNTHGPLLEVNGDTAGSVVSVNQALGFGFELSRWHRARWTFQPDAGIDFQFDGLTRHLARPPEWDRHPGALSLSSGMPFGFYDAFITDIEVTQ